MSTKLGGDEDGKAGREKGKMDGKNLDKRA